MAHLPVQSAVGGDHNVGAERAGVRRGGSQEREQEHDLLVGNPEQRRAQRRPQQRVEQDHPAGADVGRGEPGHDRGDEAVGGAARQEHVQPRVRVVPFAGGLVIEMGTLDAIAVDGDQATVQAGADQGRVIGRGRVVVGRGLDVVLPARAAARHGLRLAFQEGEPSVERDAPLVGGERGNGRIEEDVVPDVAGRRPQPQGGAHQDRALSQAGQNRREELGPQRRRADRPLPGSGDDLQFQDVVDLRSEMLGRAADAAHRERSADRELQVVVQNGGRQPERQRRLQQRAPPGACLHGGLVAVHGNRIQRAHLDDQPAGNLSLPVGRVALAPGRDRNAQVIAEPHHDGHVIHRPGLEHRTRAPVHDVAEVVGRGC